MCIIVITAFSEIEKLGTDALSLAEDTYRLMISACDHEL
jgi:hypothetical protein